MTCRHCQQLLSPHLDNALSTEERRDVLAHLEHCAACTERFQQLEQGRQLLRALPVAEVTAAMQARLLERVQSSKPVLSVVEGSKVQGQHSSLVPRYSSLVVWWNEWRLFSFGTLATATASFLFYFAMMQAPPQVSAEEVVASMDDLLRTIEPDDGERVINEETPDEDERHWQDDFEQGLFEDEDEQD